MSPQNGSFFRVKVEPINPWNPALHTCKASDEAHKVGPWRRSAGAQRTAPATFEQSVGEGVGTAKGFFKGLP